jgi:hypothetical protein
MLVESHRNHHCRRILEYISILGIILYISHREVLPEAVHTLEEGNRIERIYCTGAASARDYVSTRAHKGDLVTFLEREGAFVLEKYCRLA